jgi:hypothetical protein
VILHRVASPEVRRARVSDDTRTQRSIQRTLAIHQRASSDAEAGALQYIALMLGQLLQRVSPAERSLLIALVERLAADRYRGWACEVGDPARASLLLACAEREEEIARRVQALHPDAATVQRDILARNPDLALRMIRKPVEDTARYDRVWNEMVLPLSDAYEMNR